MIDDNREQISLTPAQVERQNRLTRFNRLTLYLPLAVLAVLIVGVMGLLCWLTLFGTPESAPAWLSFGSATADLVIILMLLPLMLLMMLFPVLAAVWFWYTWQTPRPVESWVQKWLRYTDNLVANSAAHVDNISKKAADLSIQYRSASARYGRLIERIQPTALLNRWADRPEHEHTNDRV